MIFQNKIIRIYKIRIILDVISKSSSYLRIVKGGDTLDNMKKIDLVFFTILAIAAELISSLSFKHLHSGFYFSFAILIFIVFSIRWGKIAIVSLVLSGIPLLFTDPVGSFQGIEIWKGILYHIVANGFAVIPIAIYGKRNRDKIAKSPLFIFLYVLSVFLSLSIGKEIALLILYKDPLGVSLVHISEPTRRS